ncbi:MAG: hypothetical protein ACR2LG_12430 [Actinomycetota bacterium]
MKARYSRWDGRQDPFGSEIDIGRLLDEMSDELLAGYGANGALDDIRRRGMRGMRGTDELLRALREKRQRVAEKLNTSGPLARLGEQLAEIESLERHELDRGGPGGLEKHLELDALPSAPVGKLEGMKEYEFVSNEARQRFERLLEELKTEVLNSYFNKIAGSMRDLKPEDLQRVKDMLAELNDMIAADRRGDDYDFEGFMQRYGDLWPEQPRNLQELLEIMARRMAAMSSLLASMTPEQRAEIAELAGAVLDDLDLAFQVDQLSRSLRELAPDLAWDRQVPGWGDGFMPMSGTVDAIERVAEYDDLAEALGGDYPGATLDDVDEEKLHRALGEDAVRDLRRLKEIEKTLEEVGILQRSRGRLEVTGRGAKLLGERALTRVLARARKEPTHRAGGGQAEPTGQTRPWEFGDSDPISVERTVYNAVTRSEPGEPIRLTPDDFEVIETESRPRTATVLLLDLSFSMPLRGHWVPAKKMALALHALIEGKYPEDRLYLVGFSDYARQMKPADLASAGWEEVHGTNMQHAFLLARRLLAEDRCPIKQVIMVTDGEPTAHLLPDGQALFNWPPVPVTIEKTLREAARLARSGIQINVFMLEGSPGLTSFMGRLASLTGGQAWPVATGELGDRILGDYLHRRGTRRAS